jgi:hypothetical protein
MSNGNFSLRTYSFIDSLQPQLAQYISADNRVYDPSEYDAALFCEIAPAMRIHEMIDLALKKTAARLGVVITERQYGQLEVHHSDQGIVLSAGRAVLEETGLSENDKAKCSLVSDLIVRNVQPDHAIALTGMARVGNMIVGGDSLLILECTPAAYMAYIANEALKAADVKLNLCTTWGVTGRMILGGPEAEIDASANAAKNAVSLIG